MTSEADTIIRVEGRAGRITLNRPKALNALRYRQIAEIHGSLEQWASDPAVALVILDGAGERGLCAGGDVRELYDARTSDPRLASRFWREEYVLNAYIHNYPKPFIAIMDGIVMGGGIGLSAHAGYRIVTERSLLAMPETTIGLVPDVGGTWLLAHAPGRLGEYLGLVGARMGAADALYAGFADTHVAGAQLADLIGELVDPNGEPVGSTIAEYASPPPPAEHAGRQDTIDRLFQGAHVADIVVSASAPDAPDWVRKLPADIAARSPLALELALAAIRRARSLASLERALEVEFRLVNRLYDNGEMIEGIRALIIEKDRNPRWRFGSPSEVTEAVIAPFFAPLDEPPELELSSGKA